MRTQDLRKLGLFENRAYVIMGESIVLIERFHNAEHLAESRRVSSRGRCCFRDLVDDRGHIMLWSEHARD